MRFRPPLLIRLWTVAFGLVWCGFVVVALTRTLGSEEALPATALIPAAMLVLGVTLLTRLLRLGVDVHAEEMVVRNYWRTHRLARSGVEDFRVGDGPSNGPGKVLYALTRDGDMVRPDVLASALSGGRGREKLDRRREQLREWLRGAGPRDRAYG